MQNEDLIKAGRDMLKELLEQCTEGQQLMFKRMYSHKNLDLSITDAVDRMDPKRIDWAITQCQTTVKKNHSKWQTDKEQKTN